MKTTSLSRLLSAAVFAALFTLAVPFSVSAAPVTCPTTSTGDNDGDGFTDAQECLGITTLGTIAADGTIVPGRFFPRCTQGMDRTTCVDPNTKDLFVLYIPAAGGLLGGTLLTSVPNPFAPGLAAYGLTFNSFTSLGVAVHKLDPGQIPLDTRLVMSGSQQKAVAVFENLDTTDYTLGYCQYGTPNRADGGACTVFTQRIMDYINEMCAAPNSTPVLATNPAIQTSREDMFRAYAIQIILHEVGHTVGGLAAKYTTDLGGYHYAPGTTVMEQYVVGTGRDGTCKFAIHKDFNVTSDTRAIKLK